MGLYPEGADSVGDPTKSLGLGCGVYTWRRCVVRETVADSGDIVVEWDGAGGEVGATKAFGVRFCGIQSSP